MPNNTPIRDKLDAARRDLLDLTTRNRLLNTPRHRVRSRSIEIVDERPEHVFRILVREGRPMSFLPASADAKRTGGELADDARSTADVKSADQESQTPPPEAADQVPSVGQAGDRIGAWILESLVGKGTFGEVWRAHHHQFDNKTAAVKLSTDPTYVRFLRRESQIIHHLGHPNIVAVLDADPYADPPYLAMEFVDGTPLRRLIAGRPLAVGDAIHIGRQILKAIGHAHEHKTIHYDIKPENVLVDQTGNVKLVDFGLGKVDIDTTRSMIQSQSISSEADEGLRGSLPYMSPEQIQGQSVDHRCDLFAFGRLWFEMLAGRLPLGWDEKPSTLRPELDRTCDEIYARSTASLAHRAGSADELLRLLDSVEAEEADGHESSAFSTLSSSVDESTWAEDASHFPGQPEDDEVDEHGVPKRHIDSRLQTTLESQLLQRRLLSTYYDANTFEEEQGVSPLYLALGFLKWYESQGAKRARFAPLILVPVVIERRSARVKFRINYSGEDITTNLSLQARLKDEFGIELPEVPDVDDLSPADYFNQVATAVAGQPRWEVLPDDMVMSFFSFSKFIMYRDLDPANWPHDRAIDRHPLIVSLLGDGFTHEEPLCGDHENLDRLISPLDIVHVLDADSSQAQVIEEIKTGRNLVIQGPPGTGKSQTITNLIAAAVKDGKKVLFVAEKMAALNVVKRRLDNIGLGDLCLELHSRKAKKRLVLDELERTLDLGRPQVADVVDQARLLQRLRGKLNGYVDELHEVLDPAGLTPFQVIGELVRLRTTGVPPADFELDDPLSWTADAFRERCSRLREVATIVQDMGVPAEHPWRGVRLGSMLPTDLSRLKDRLLGHVESVKELTSLLTRFAQGLGLDEPADFGEAVRLVKVGNRLSAAPAMDGQAMGSSVWQQRGRDIGSLIDAGKSHAAVRRKLEGTVTNDAWATDISTIRRDLATHGRSWFRFLNGSYRRANAALRGLLAGPPPKSLRERLDVLNAIRVGQNARTAVDNDADLGRQAFGQAWRGLDSDWERLTRIRKWDAENQSAGDADVCRTAATRDVDVAKVNTDTQQLASALDRCLTHVRDLFQDLQLDAKAAFESNDITRIPIQLLTSRLDEWHTHINSMSQWINYRTRHEQLEAEGMARLADRLYGGQLKSEAAGDGLKMAYYEALIGEMIRKHPTLATFDGRAHEQVQEEFRAQDVRRIELARQEVAQAHYQSIPRGLSDIGQMGVVRREIAKQRRHLPIRRLLHRAGHAIQGIKPVMMMSPVSVAQFLEPGSLEFDLLLIDEASQVRPVDALGAVARSKQIAVVGDDKQLPPTQFFDRVLGDEALDDDEAFATSDVESVLGLCTAQRVPNRMLLWHYRSRHHTLIAVSNREFYDGRLHVVPSPSDEDLDRESIGLSYRYVPNGVYDRGGTRMNAEEARTVAQAVIEHARHHGSLTLGVGAFSVAQRDAILEQLERLRRSEVDVEPFFSPEHSEPFFVKNLENIQGDERDVVLISVGYGPDATGRVSMNFGPLSAIGGERRLNVLITRARRRCVVFSSLTADDIDTTRASGRGPHALKAFLNYAEHGEADDRKTRDGPYASVFEASVAGALEKQGYELHPRVGVSGFFVDLAVVDPDKPSRYVLGIECDGHDYHSARWARDRDRLRRQVLEDRGWTIHRIWSPDWFNRADDQMRNTIEAIRTSAVRTATRDAAILDKPRAKPEAGVTRSGVGHEQGTARGVKVAPYREAGFAVPKGRDIHQLPVRDLARSVCRVVDIEGPIHREEIVRRLAQLWGHKRTGTRIAEVIDAAVRWAVHREKLIEDHEFYSLNNRQPVSIRDRSDVESATLRKPEMLPPAEVRAALLHVVGSHAGVTEDEAINAAARMLGFRVTTSALRAVIASQLDPLIDGRALLRKGDALIVA